MGALEGVPEAVLEVWPGVKTIFFKNNAKMLFAFLSFLFSYKYIIGFPRIYRMCDIITTLTAEADIKTQLFSIKTDTKKTYQKC